MLVKHTWFHSDYRYILYFATLAPLAELQSLQSKVLLYLKNTNYLICWYRSTPIFSTVTVIDLKFSTLSLASVFYCLAFSYILSLVYGATTLHHQKPERHHPTFKDISNGSETDTWRLSSLKLFALNEFYYIVTNAPIYLVALVALSAGASGRYNVMLTISNLILCLHSAFATILTPNISTNIKTTAGKAKLQSLLVTLIVAYQFSGLLYWL